MTFKPILALDDFVQTHLLAISQKSKIRNETECIILSHEVILAVGSVVGDRWPL